MKRKKIAYTLLATLMCAALIRGAWTDCRAYVILDGDDGSRTVLMDDDDAPLIIDNPDGTSEIYFGQNDQNAILNHMSDSTSNSSSQDYSDSPTSTGNEAVANMGSDAEISTSDSTTTSDSVAASSGSESSGGTSSNSNNAAAKNSTKTYTDAEINAAWKAVTTVDPTCATDGYTEYKNSLTGKTKQEAIPATGKHTYEVTDSTDATCTEAGSVTYTCSVCGDTYTEETDLIDHTYEVTETTDATCTEDGSTTYTCSVCGDTYEETIPATGHDDGEWTVTKSAGAFSTGSKELRCTVCGKVLDTETIPQTCPIPLAGVVAIVVIVGGAIAGVVIVIRKKMKNIQIDI